MKRLFFLKMHLPWYRNLGRIPKVGLLHSDQDNRNEKRRHEAAVDDTA